MASYVPPTSDKKDLFHTHPIQHRSCRILCFGKSSVLVCFTVFLEVIFSSVVHFDINGTVFKLCFLFLIYFSQSKFIPQPSYVGICRCTYFFSSMVPSAFPSSYTSIKMALSCIMAPPCDNGGSIDVHGLTTTGRGTNNVLFISM